MLERTIPELASRLAKFSRGVRQWSERGQIDLADPDDVSRVRLILRVLDETPGFDFFDETFNGCDIDTVCEIIGIGETVPVREEAIEFDYTVWPVDSFEEAEKYRDSVTWCIVMGKESFDAYTAGGNRFWFCGNGDWRNVPCVPGEKFPYDRYGYSLLAVEVTPAGEIVSVTSRWNTCAADTGDFLSPAELHRTLGDENFNKITKTT